MLVALLTPRGSRAGSMRRATMRLVAATRNGASVKCHPHLIDSDAWSFLTVDPSPTEFWAVIWWVYDPDTDRRYIINLWRQRMNPEDFLSLDLNTFDWSGLIPRSERRSEQSGAADHACCRGSERRPTVVAVAAACSTMDGTNRASVRSAHDYGE